ncbi:C2H2 type zinc finger-containing protein [Pleurostoma richardsiae]|uniref:C2H2 type zinc finger-containing protein n=1 Tax=Pleurostoma richardsiae TaxID=41990 RepID=A0AA38RLY7_9PEZI|nr:C2H2 type zinc finger-containing protein [Pleurostoma richardsiae]
MASITGTRAPSGGASTAEDPTITHPYTCNSCQVAFRNSDLQKGHMRSDWHRYNLKRRVASLPPISSEIFTEKVLQARASTTAEAERAGFQKECDVCQRTYYSENSYQNHIGSQKHKAREAAMAHRQNGVPDDVSSVMSSTFSLGEPIPVRPSHPELDSDAEAEFTNIIEGLKKADLQDRPSPVKRPSNPHLSAAAQHKADHPVSQSSSELQSSTSTESPTPVPSSKASAPALTLKSCLFCNYDSPTVALSAIHMERIHGMFIPEKQYLVDLEGLLKALQERIQEFHECLYCGKVKSTAFAVQTHMRDKGHCKIPYTTEEEQLIIGEFYDFRSSYSDEEDEDSEDESETGDKNNGVKLGARRPTTTTGEDGDEIVEQDDGWETDSSASSLDSADLTAVPAEQHYHQYERLNKHPHHSHDDPRAHHRVDGWHSKAHKHTHAVFYDDYELHLPSGKSVGHRSLNRYYRQNLHDYPTPEERAERQQLAIENGDADAMDVDCDNQLVSTREQMNRNRALASRANGGLGMQGVSDRKKSEVRRAEQRGRTRKTFQERRNEWAVNKKANNQKFYHYSIL